MGSYSTDKPCTACNKLTENGNCLHHIKTRKSGGKDVYYNLMPLCLKHHNEVHAKGLTWFSQKYNNVEFWLIKHGWEYSEFNNKWIMPS